MCGCVRVYASITLYSLGQRVLVVVQRHHEVLTLLLLSVPLV